MGVNDMSIMNQEELKDKVIGLVNNRLLVKSGMWDGGGFTLTAVAIVKDGDGYEGIVADNFGNVETFNGKNKRLLWDELSHNANVAAAFGR